MRKTVMCVLLLIVAITILSATKPKLAVYGFDSTSFSQEEIAGLTSLLESELFDLGYFSIVERASLEKILKEKKLESGGIVGSTERAVELGKLVGADYIAFGKIDRALNNIVLSFKIVDVNTGEVVFSVSKTLSYGSQLETLIKSMVKTIKVDQNGRIMKEKGVEEVAGTLPAPQPSAPFPETPVSGISRSRLYLELGTYVIPDFSGYGSAMALPVLKIGKADYRNGEITEVSGVSLPTLGMFYRSYFGALYGEMGIMLLIFPYIEFGISIANVEVGLMWFSIPYIGVSLAL